MSRNTLPRWAEPADFHQELALLRLERGGKTTPYDGHHARRRLWGGHRVTPTHTSYDPELHAGSVGSHAQDAAAILSDLTQDEREIAYLLAAGFTAQDAAAHLGISVRSWHRRVRSLRRRVS